RACFRDARLPARRRAPVCRIRIEVWQTRRTGENREVWSPASFRERLSPRFSRLGNGYGSAKASPRTVQARNDAPAQRALGISPALRDHRLTGSRIVRQNEHLLLRTPPSMLPTAG